jgi:hypothetical protein
LREEVFQDCYEHWVSSLGNKPFWGELAKRWGYKSGEELRDKFKNERNKRGIKSKNFVEHHSDEDITYQESSTKNVDGTYTSDKLVEMFEENLKDDVFLLNAHGFDPKKWTLVWAKSNLWHGPTKAGKQVMYQSKITVRPKEMDDISYTDVMEMFKKKEYITPFNLERKSEKDVLSGEYLEIDVCDLHFGSDANHSPEKRFEDAIADIIDRIGDRKFDKIYFPLLADIFHYDNFQKATTGGTIVTTDGLSPYDIFDLGIESFVRVIGKLSEISPVEVLYIAGNHDRISGYHLVKLLEAFFKDSSNVTFDSEHKSRKYRVIGTSLVGWMHGDMPKARASNWLQVEAREEWGKTRYSEIHSGNFHSQSGKEDGGVVLRYLPALTNIDQWHYDKGYVGATRSMVSFVWDKELGLREIWYSNV